MLILQTGVPGSGKTSSIIALLMQDESYTHYTDSEGVKRERPLFTNGIPDLKIEHNELTDEQIKEQPFQDFLPYGSLVVIDEAQRLFPTRSAAAKVPPYIEALATHRHHGLDIVFITQHPSFLDSFVRRLVQRHMHISIKPVGRKLYEWNECVDQPESSQNIARAIEVNFKLPKEAFGMYKSAEIHTKPKRRLPKSLIFLLFFLPALLGYGWYTYTRMSAKFMQQENAEVVSSETPDNGQNPQTDGQSKGGQNYKTADNGRTNLQNGQNLTPEMFVPTIPERVESKPIYNSIRQVQQYERLAACIDGGKSGCTCYTDQATKIKEIPQKECKQYAKNGLPFDPFRQPPVTAPMMPQQQETPIEAPKVASLGGQDKLTLLPDYTKGPTAQ